LLDENRVLAGGSTLVLAQNRAVTSKICRAASAGETRFGARTRAPLERGNPAVICKRTVANVIKKIYGDSVDIAFGQNPALIGALRVKVWQRLFMTAVSRRV